MSSDSVVATSPIRMVRGFESIGVASNRRRFEWRTRERQHADGAIHLYSRVPG